MSNIAYMSACVSMSGFCHGSSDSRPPDAAGRLRPPHGQLSAGVRASENNREGELLQMIFCMSSRRNPPSVATLPPLFFSQLMNTAPLHKHPLPLPYKSPAHRQDHRNKIIRLSETVKGHHGNGVNFMHVIIVFGCNEYLSKKG